MSLIRFSNDAAELFTVRKYSRCSGVSLVSSANSVIPAIAFIGVRISWLMLAKNSLFACVASSALFLRPFQLIHQLRQPPRIFFQCLPRRFQMPGILLQLLFRAPPLDKLSDLAPQRIEHRQQIRVRASGFRG